MTTTTDTDTPRIYVACLASYNAGILHGEWIDATDADVIREAIANMLSSLGNRLLKSGQFTITKTSEGFTFRSGPTWTR